MTFPPRCHYVLWQKRCLRNRRCCIDGPREKDSFSLQPDCRLLTTNISKKGEEKTRRDLISSSASEKQTHLSAGFVKE